MSDPLAPHSHDPNPEPPGPDPTLQLRLPDGTAQLVTVADLKRLPYSAVANCYIVSTGHGTSGPFTFGGVTLLALLTAYWSPRSPDFQVEVVSGDGFGSRIEGRELLPAGRPRPILLSYEVDDMPLTRGGGLVRLIVPSEIDDALRQVKWVASIRVVGGTP